MHQNIFRIGRLIDYWSIPHFLFGTVMAFGAAMLSYSFPQTFLVTFVLALLWEYTERRFRLREAPGNSTMDVVLALISVGITFVFAESLDRALISSGALFVVAGILFLCVNYFAWVGRFDHEREFRG